MKTAVWIGFMAAQAGCYMTGVSSPKEVALVVAQVSAALVLVYVMESFRSNSE